MRRLVHRYWTRFTGLAAVVSLALAGSITAAPQSAEAASAAITASVSVDANRALATIPTTGVGMNVAVYDGNMNHSAVPGLLRDAGVGMIRYPGGSYSDGYHWQTHTVEEGYVAPNTEFDTFMGTARSVGAQPVITANYGSGTPDEAAAWVRYANGARMITKLGAPGDTLVRAVGSTPLVSAHAVRRANGDVNVMLINKDPANDATVTVAYSGFTPSSATPTVYSYLKNATSIGSATTGSATRQTVPAYSVVVVQLRSAG